MPAAKTIEWYEISKPVAGLATNAAHDFILQREALPLIFVPGIMGTCLKRAGTDGTGNADGLPNMRWNPSSTGWMLKHVSGTSGATRKAMLIGSQFDSNYLEPNNAGGDGFGALMADYCKKFLTPLKAHDWKSFGHLFDFPVHAFGYNWSDSAENSGKKLAARILEIIESEKKRVGRCSKVILITHSMGGLVSRAASELAGAADAILGIVHGVQPVTGTPAAYWRIKAGFEGMGPTSRVLGNSGDKVTPILGNSPGGLQLLPNKLHRTNDGSRRWLRVTDGADTLVSLPRSDPYDEIYRVKAVVRPEPGNAATQNAYWGLVDPALLDPGNVNLPAENSNDRLDAEGLPSDAWSAFEKLLDIAEGFHQSLGVRQHTRTYSVCGIGHKSADVVQMHVKSNWVRSESYPVRGFRGFFRDADGDDRQAVLQDPEGEGDGTVVQSSGSALAKSVAMEQCRVEHQPAFEDDAVQAFAIESIVALCRARCEEKQLGLMTLTSPSTQLD